MPAHSNHKLPALPRIVRKLLLETSSATPKTNIHIPVILDAKRGDISSTAEQYAIEAFERYR